MLSRRTENILKSIVGQYITRATPVPSRNINDDDELRVSSATIRNEMAVLEQEGYIKRPHPSAGSVPLDKGYRSYVGLLGDIQFPLEEQMQVSHVFHQVEQELLQWLNLAATITAQKAQNLSLVSIPRTKFNQFKHLELVSLNDSLVLVVLVLRGALVRQQLIEMPETVSQSELTEIANRLSDLYSGLSARQITDKEEELSERERHFTDCIVKLIEAEDDRESQDMYLDGLHYTLNQPEFTGNPWLSQTLTGLIEQRGILRQVLPSGPLLKGVQVIIGKENEAEAIQDYSVVISEYGLPGDAAGVLCVIGPTRMPYGRTIATVRYLSAVLSGLVGRLYGAEPGWPASESGS